VTPRARLIIAGLAGFTAVAGGAFAAHALKEQLSPAALQTFQTGAHYHLAHAVVLLALALAPPSVSLTRAFNCIALGIMLFSGSLYALALTGAGWLGPITPVGGGLFLLGWALLVRAGWDAKR
jgi:uncharacterized membrane protein YgdD (TMEM256/DUF423 family)